MWYVLILLCIAFMVVSYRANKARLRRPPSAPRKKSLLANDTATISIATLVLVFVSFIIVSATPNPTAYKESKHSHELAFQRAMAQRLATELRAVVRSGQKALVVAQQPLGDIDQEHHQAIMDGLKAGFGESVELVTALVEAADLEEEEDESGASKNFRVKQERFSEILKDEKNYDFLVCLVGVPERYKETSAALKAAKTPPDLGVGILTDNIYMQGESLFKKEISVCIVPKRAAQYHEDEPAEGDLQANFDTRYLMVTPSTLAKFGRDNPRMIKRYRAW